MQLDVDVQGLAEIERRLKMLPQRLGNNAMRRALRKGANVIRNEARNNAKRIDDPETREQIWKNIAVAGGGRRREKRVGGVMMRVGVRGGAKQRKGGGTYHVGGSKSNPGGDTWYWRLIEFGFTHDRSGRPIPARPFMRQAMGKAQAAADAITKDMRIQVDREIAKLNSQIGNTGG